MRPKSKILQSREAHQPSKAGARSRVLVLKGQLGDLDTLIKRRREAHAIELEKLLEDREKLNHQIKELE